MNETKIQTVKNELPTEPYRFTKRLGSTTYLVGVYSSKTSNETANDKIARLIKNSA